MDFLSVSLAFIDGLGAPEMLLIFVLVLVLFGGNKLPEFARGLGKTMREFKKAAAGVEEEFKRALEEDERKQNAANYTPPPALPAGSTPTTDPAGPHGSTDHYHDEYGHEYYENQDGTANQTPATTETDPTKPGAGGLTDAAATTASAPTAAAPSSAPSDPAGPAAPESPTPSATPPPPAPPAAGGSTPNPPPAGPAAST